MPGISVSKICVPFGGGGINWSSYWATRYPSVVEPHTVSDAQIDIVWTNNGVADYTGVSIERSADGTAYAEIDTVVAGAAIYSDTTITANTLYYYRIRYYKDANYGDYSSVVTAPFFLKSTVIPADVVAAYNPIHAATLAASYNNLINPATHALTEGAAVPTIINGKGWIFHTSEARYLVSDIIVDANDTLIISFDGGIVLGPSSELHVPMGVYLSSSSALAFSNKADFDANNKHAVWKGGRLIESPALFKGIMAIAGQKLYLDGTLKTPDITNGTLPAVAPYIGGLRLSDNSIIQCYTGVISSIVWYNRTLTQAEITAITNNFPVISTKKSADTQLKEDYLNNEFGALVCFNMPTFLDTEIADGDLDVDTFAPTDMDIDNWVSAIDSAGMTYAMLTAKHHDGFCLWPTAYYDVAHDPYSIAETTWYANNGQIDILGEFISKLRVAGIKPCIYFSIWDKTHEIRSGGPNANKYMAMLTTQFTELLTNYGFIHAIWLDGYWTGLWHQINIPPDDVINLIKSISPNTIVIINDHVDTYSEIITEEMTYVDYNNTSPVEDVKPLNGRWFYNTTIDQDATRKTKYFINSWRRRCMINNATSLLGIYVDRTGHIEPGQATLLGTLNS